MQINETPVHKLAQTYSPSVSNEKYQNKSPSLSHQTTNLDKTFEQTLENSRPIISSNNINTEELTVTLLNYLHNLLEQPKTPSQTNEIFNIIKHILPMLKPTHPNLPVSSLPMSLTDDEWFITQSFIFHSHFSSSINLSKELINCVKLEEQGRDKLLKDYNQAIDLLKQRDQEIFERLKILNEFYEELLKINQINLIENLLNNHLWNLLFKATDEAENLCEKMIKTTTKGISEDQIKNKLDFIDLKSIFDGHLSKQHKEKLNDDID